MSSVWLAIPSARDERSSTLPLWRARGYKIALFRNPGASPVDCADIVLEGEYPGYAVATNVLCAEILAQDPTCDWIVGGGDDVQPEMELAPERIARECTNHFGGTFGVMQPTGDRFTGGSIDRIAGSPWMGREWCLRINDGQGPLWNEYEHMFVDEELLCVAEKLGVYWRRPDLIHLHHHFMRASHEINSPAIALAPPPHLAHWNSPEHWAESSTIFAKRKAAGFPGCEPLKGGA